MCTYLYIIDELAPPPPPAAPPPPKSKLSHP